MAPWYQLWGWGKWADRVGRCRVECTTSVWERSRRLAGMWEELYCLLKHVISMRWSRYGYLGGALGIVMRGVVSNS